MHSEVSRDGRAALGRDGAALGRNGASSGDAEFPILILAPLRNDARLTANFLETAGLCALPCADVHELCARAQASCGAVLLAEEALDAEAVQLLSALLAQQPSWSDLPIAVVTSGGDASQERQSRLGAFGRSGNVILIERPFRPGTLISTLEAALRSRRRQYQVRDLLEKSRRDAEVLRASQERHRILAEKAAQQARIYDATLSSTLDFLYVFDLQGRFRYINRALLALWQLGAEEVIGKRLDELNYPPEQAAKLQQQIQHVIDTGQAIRDEMLYTSAFGTRAYEYIFSPVFGVGGIVEAVAGSTRDITERREVERTLREADRRKDEFLAMLAHELRNPLSSITNAVTLLKETEDGENRVWAAAVITRQARQLTRLVDDLLDVSRITRGKIELRRELLDAASCLESACEAVAPLIAERGHTLLATVPRGELWLEADPARLEQIVVNLLANAAKYSEPRGRIWLEARRTDGEIVIEVRDSGIGMEPEKIPAMFELFAQGKRSAARNEGGLGIGLTVVRGLCEMHGGSISAHSAGLGAGSTFVVRLPAANRLPSARIPGDSSMADGAGMRLLIVDDNVDTAHGLARLLTRRRYDVRLAHDGPAALEIAQTFSPAVVLLDIGLPGMDGYEVARRLRAEPRCAGALIIALSGYGQDEDRRLSREAGFDHHLVKPVDLEQIYALLRDPQSAGCA